MIVSFRDKRTRAFFDGVWIKAFQGFERQANAAARGAGNGPRPEKIPEHHSSEKSSGELHA